MITRTLHGPFGHKTQMQVLKSCVMSNLHDRELGQYLCLVHLEHASVNLSNISI
jgi:hypothetical protein